MFSALNRRTDANAYAFLVLTMAFWAGNHILGRWATGIIPPMTLSFFRWSLAGLIMLTIGWRALAADWPAIRANLPFMLLLTVLGSGLYNTVQYVALTETTATSAGIFNSWGPILVAVFVAIIYREPLRPAQLLGMMTSLAGVFVIVLKGDLSNLAKLQFNRGDFIMLFAVSMWALYTALLRNRPNISTLAFSTFTFAAAGLINAPLAFYEFQQGQLVTWSWMTVAAILYAAIPASLLGYFLYTRSVEILGPTRSGAFIHLIPIFVAIQAMFLIGEDPRLFHFVGFGLILTGVYVASRTQRPRDA
jgi:drug/metabolite transporter (DMT)-like permease